MYKLLHPLEQTTSPFAETPRTNERAHWVRPKIVVEVKFNEWTADRKLRQPIFLGIRDDKDAREVGPGPPSVQRKSAKGGARIQKQVDAKAEKKRTTHPTSSVADEIEAMEAAGGEGVLRLP